MQYLSYVERAKSFKVTSCSLHLKEKEIRHRQWVWVISYSGGSLFSVNFSSKFVTSFWIYVFPFWTGSPNFVLNPLPKTSKNFKLLVGGILPSVPPVTSLRILRSRPFRVRPSAQNWYHNVLNLFHFYRHPLILYSTLSWGIQKSKLGFWKDFVTQRQISAQNWHYHFELILFDLMSSFPNFVLDPSWNTDWFDWL